MKIIHTSDWHIGRSLHGYSLHEHHELFINDLIAQTRRCEPDALIIAGDFFDQAVPSHESILLARNALQQLTQIAPVIITPGNHDSATRLGWLGDFLISELTICGDIDRLHHPLYLRCRTKTTKPMIISKDAVTTALAENAEVGVIYGLPYLHPHLARPALEKITGHELERSHQAMMSAAMDLIAENYRDEVLRFAPDGLPSVVIAHAFVTGSRESDSERDISVGGLSDISKDTYARPTSNDSHQSCIDYVAMGHLHRAQTVQTREDHSVPDIAYCGSPIAFSFSEADYTKVQYEVDIERGKPAKIHQFEVPVRRPLATIRGTMDELLSDKFSDKREYFLEIIPTDEKYPVDMTRKLLNHFPYALFIHREIPQGHLDDEKYRLTTSDKRSVFENLCDFMVHAAGDVQLNANEERILQEIFDEVRKKEAIK